MSRLTNYLDSLSVRKKDSKNTSSKYYSFKGCIIRVSDHVTFKTSCLSIIIPKNNNKLYIVQYMNNLLQFNYHDLKIFINNFISIKNIEENNKIKNPEIDNSSWENYATSLARKYKSYKKYSKTTRGFLKYLFLHKYNCEPIVIALKSHDLNYCKLNYKEICAGSEIQKIKK